MHCAPRTENIGRCLDALPCTILLPGFKDSADQFLDANIQLAIAAGRVVRGCRGYPVAWAVHCKAGPPAFLAWWWRWHSRAEQPIQCPLSFVILCPRLSVPGTQVTSCLTLLKTGVQGNWEEGPYPAARWHRISPSHGPVSLMPELHLATHSTPVCLSLSSQALLPIIRLTFPFRCPHTLPRYGNGLSLGSGLTLGHLRESRPGKFGTWFRAQANSADPDVDAAAAGKEAQVFFALNASAVELPDIERYATDSLDAGKPLITWNLALDTLRADLGQDPV